MFDGATHPDFLGACLGTGIDRRKIGDILVIGEQGAQILCTPEVAPFLEMALTQVRGAWLAWKPLCGTLTARLHARTLRRSWRLSAERRKK